MSEFMHEVIKRRTTITTTTFNLSDDPWSDRPARMMAQWEEELIALLTPPPGDEPF